MIPDCMRNPAGAHRWGTKGREYNTPLPDDYCSGCHRRYRDIQVPSEHLVIPDVYPVLFRQDWP